MARKLAFADAVVEVSFPGQRAARRRISVILPVMPSSCSRKLAGAVTIMAFTVCMAWLDGGVARHLEVADHLDGAGFRQGLAAQHGPGGAFGVERIALAVLMAQLTVIDLEDRMAVCLQEARQAGAVATDPLDPERPDRSERLGPRFQIPIAGRADGIVIAPRRAPSVLMATAA